MSFILVYLKIYARSLTNALAAIAKNVWTLALPMGLMVAFFLLGGLLSGGGFAGGMLLGLARSAALSIYLYFAGQLIGRQRTGLSDLKTAIGAYFWSSLNLFFVLWIIDLLLATAGGMAIRFNEQDARLMGRPAEGVKGIELDEGDQVIGVVRIPMRADAEGDYVTADPSMTLLTITDKGYGKRTPIDEYRVQPETGKPRSQSRGGKGRVDIKLTDKNGRSIAALHVTTGDDVVVITRGGQLVRIPAGTIRGCGRGTQGVRVASLNEGDQVIAAARVLETDKTDEAPPTAPEGEGAGEGPAPEGS